MAYQSHGLGQLIVAALRAASRDPQLYDKVDAANTRLDDLTSRVENLVNELKDNEALDEGQKQELEAVKTDLDDLATALQGGVMEDVEDPNADVGGDTGIVPPIDDNTVPTDTGTLPDDTTTTDVPSDTEVPSEVVQPSDDTGGSTDTGTTTDTGTADEETNP